MRYRTAVGLVVALGLVGAAAVRQRAEAIRRKPHAPYPWDGVADVRPFGALEGKVIEGVY